MYVLYKYIREVRIRTLYVVKDKDNLNVALTTSSLFCSAMRERGRVSSCGLTTTTGGCLVIL